MSSEGKPDVRLEIAHVLFMDVVGYSKLLINDQSAITGDGMALVFSNNVEAPAKCALEISQALQSYPHIPLRMGVHSGPINPVSDVNDRSNVTGAGINIAQRVMDCGDAGHILVSRRVAEDLEQYRQWQPYLHDLGECEVKHRVRVHIFNLYTGEVGNPNMPEKLRKRRRIITGSPIWRRKGTLAGIAAAILVIACSLIIPHLRRTHAVGDEKSIAVLPFVDLSPAKDQEYFCDGISEELLDALSRVPGLRVVARTSSFSFKGKNADVSEIGQKLGVATVLEGSLRREGNQIRVTAQLVNAKDGSHLWSDTFERELKSVFAVQDEITHSIVGALKVQLGNTPAPRPRGNTEAYDLYLQGLYYSNKSRKYGAG